MAKLEKISNKKMDEVSGGLSVDADMEMPRVFLSVTEDEAEVLKKNGFIDKDGKFDVSMQREAARCLKENGFENGFEVDESSGIVGLPSKDRILSNKMGQADIKIIG